MKQSKTLRALTAVILAIALATSFAPAAFAESSFGLSDADLADLPANQAESDAYTGAVPTLAQYQYQKDELAAFCHFGPNTFNNVEWGDRYGSLAPSEIFPLDTPIDAYGYVYALKEAGFTRIIVTAKHHDGFCLWNSAYTDYDIASTNYPGDVLAELSAACTYYDMDMGLYLSPWDVHEPSYGYYDKAGNPTTPENDALDYNEFYLGQLTEILGNNAYGNNGRFVEVWLDGAKGSGANAQAYDAPAWQNTIYSLEPDCLIFGAVVVQDIRWIGNERGFAPDTNWAQAYYVDANGNYVESAYDAVGLNINKSGNFSYGHQGGNAWTVPECDARLTPGWFWGPDKSTPKSMQELADMYFNSVGHNATLLLNVPLNAAGGLDAETAQRIAEFGETMRLSFGENLALGAQAYATSVYANSRAYSPFNAVDGAQGTAWAPQGNAGSLVVDLGGVVEFDIVSIEEEITQGQRIDAYSVMCSTDGTRWATLEEGTTVGAKRLCQNGLASARYIKITVSAPEGTRPIIDAVGIYRGTGAFAASNAFAGEETVDLATCIFPQEVGANYAVVLEAESALLHNTYAGSGTERWPLEIKAANWASGGQFVNSCNEGDSLTFAYDAPKAGVYEVVLSYRSGDPRNGFTVAEANGKVEPVTVSAGAPVPNSTKTVSFLLHVLEAGRGTLVISAGDHKAPQMDRFDISFVEEDRLFEFPNVTGSGVVLEAESALLHNTYAGSGTERWPLEIKAANWASGGQFVNSCNEGDSLAFDYYATEVGTYEVVLSYRSGDPRNGFTLTEQNGKIEPVTVNAGAQSPSSTKSAIFTIKVLSPGRGTLVLSAGQYKAPQLDTFEITFR